MTTTKPIRKGSSVMWLISPSVGSRNWSVFGLSFVRFLHKTTCCGNMNIFITYWVSSTCILVPFSCENPGAILVYHDALCSVFQLSFYTMDNPLQWCDMGIIPSQITGNLNVCSADVQTINKENINDLHYWPFMREIHRWPCNLSQNAFPYHDIIMLYDSHISNIYKFF